MKRVLIAAVAFAVLSGPALAQGKGRSGGGARSSTTDTDRQKRMAKEEAAAQAAMKNIPDSKEKYDPWKIGK